jgi:hypothetical protein
VVLATVFDFSNCITDDKELHVPVLPRVRSLSKTCFIASDTLSKPWDPAALSGLEAALYMPPMPPEHSTAAPAILKSAETLEAEVHNANVSRYQ